MVKKERLGGLRMLNFDLLCRFVSSPTVAMYQVCLCRVLLIILASQANMLCCVSFAPVPSMNNHTIIYRIINL